MYAYYTYIYLRGIMWHTCYRFIFSIFYFHLFSILYVCIRMQFWCLTNFIHVCPSRVLKISLSLSLSLLMPLGTSWQRHSRESNSPHSWQSVPHRARWRRSMERRAQHHRMAIPSHLGPSDSAIPLFWSPQDQADTLVLEIRAPNLGSRMVSYITKPKAFDIPEREAE